MEVVATSAFLAVCATVAVLPTAAGVKAAAIALGRPVCDKAIKAAGTIASLTIFLMFLFFPLYLISVLFFTLKKSFQAVCLKGFG
ncbi:hypothetical protein [Lactobacillus delbrueckii]|uniref:hypothetical protein n=1 Tax=Lactobacillus delbrueckii TaxID=1584 RepID=UPI001F2747E1|nr:hypothetical protein [Lactobacillus delbrueckii]MDK8262151.1 hypothetical protein [Lactobacillus delbrueckii]